MEVAYKRNESAHFNINEENYGLLNGKMVQCIWDFYHSRQNGDVDQLAVANDLLDNIAENIFSIDGYDYANGLAGVGFAIEWLTQNGYIDCDTDEILGEIDDEIYKSVVYSKSTNHSLLEGTTGKAYYFYKRLMSTNPSKTRYKQICLIECLILLSDELTDYLMDQEIGLCSTKSLEDISDQEIMNMCQILILFEKILKKRINVEAIRTGICGISKFIERICLKGNSIDIPINALPLVYSHTVVGIEIGDPIWQSKSKLMYKIFSSLSRPEGANEIYDFMVRKLSQSIQENNTEVKTDASPNNLTSLLVLPGEEIAELMLLR